jgi:hypothetical protein
MSKYYFTEDNCTGYYEFGQSVEADSFEEAMQLIYDKRSFNTPILISLKGWDNIQGDMDRTTPDFVLLPWRHPEFPSELEFQAERCEAQYPQF